MCVVTLKPLNVTKIDSQVTSEVILLILTVTGLYKYKHFFFFKVTELFLEICIKDS